MKNNSECKPCNQNREQPDNSERTCGLPKRVVLRRKQNKIPNNFIKGDYKTIIIDHRYVNQDFVILS